jgi:hypothetical protein
MKANFRQTRFYHFCLKHFYNVWRGNRFTGRGGEE